MFTLVQDRSPAGWQTYWVGGSQLWLVNISLKQCWFSDLWGVPMWMNNDGIDGIYSLSSAHLMMTRFRDSGGRTWSLSLRTQRDLPLLLGRRSHRSSLSIKLICSFYVYVSFLGSNNCISSICLSPTNHLTSSHCWLYRRWKDQPSVNTVSWWFFL